MHRLARAHDDGYDHWLVPGLRATVEARRLADELAFAAARLDELREDPPGLYAQARAGEPEEGLWLSFLIAYMSPLEGPDPWAGIAAARTAWATGELPALDAVALGPRAAHDPARGDATVAAYRARAQRAGSQAAALIGDGSLTPQRGFDRAFERLSLPGMHRAARYEFLVVAGHLGLLTAEPSSLLLGADPTDPTVLAAKRILGIGDAINLGRRASELAAECALPIAALDLGFLNWARAEDERVRAGSIASGDPQLRERLRAVLRAEPLAEDEPAAPDDV